MQIEIQALARGKYNRSAWRLSAGVMRKQYHGFLGVLQRIIESRALRDKRSCARKTNLPQRGLFWSLDGPPAHIDLDTGRGETVPGKATSGRAALGGPGLLEQPHQFCLFGQECVVPVGAGHLAVVGLDAGGANRIGELAHMLRREKPI